MSWSVFDIVSLSIEHIGKFKKKKEEVLEKPKELLHKTQKGPVEWKREVLQGRKRSSVHDKSRPEEAKDPAKV
jgi:hypothetical protein